MCMHVCVFVCVFLQIMSEIEEEVGPQCEGYDSNGENGWLKLWLDKEREKDM